MLKDGNHHDTCGAKSTEVFGVGDGQAEKHRLHVGGSIVENQRLVHEEEKKHRDELERQMNLPAASDEQAGGDHYKNMKMQPDEFIYMNDIPYHEGCIIKYACRWRLKGGELDVEKIIHYAQLLLERSRKHGQ